MKIEDFMTSHRDEFFDTAPAINHRDVMASKLRGRKRRRGVRLWAVSMSAAAVVAAVALMVIAPTSEDLTPSTMANSELSELDNYYRIKRTQSITTIEELLVDKDAAMQIEIREQVVQIENETNDDKLPAMLLTIDIDKYIAYTVQRYEVQNDNLNTLINILQQ